MPKASEFAAAGMWADRDDLSNPTEYVGKLREHLQPGGTILKEVALLNAVEFKPE